MATPDRGAVSFEQTRDNYLSMPVDSFERPQPATTIPPADPSSYDNIEASWRSLFAFTTRRHTKSLVWCGIVTVLTGLVRPVPSIFFGYIFQVLTEYGADHLNPRDTKQQVSKWCMALAITAIVTWLFNGMLLSVWMVFGELQAKSVREKLFAGLLEKEMEWYDMRKDGMGPLLIRIQTQVRELQLAVSQPLGFLLVDIVGAFATLGTAFYFSWKLTLVLVAVFPVTAVLLFIISTRLGPAIEAQKRELTQASKYCNSAITEIETVKAFNGQEQEVWQYFLSHRKAASSYLVQAMCNALQFGVTKFVMVGIFVQGFWYGIVLVRQGVDPGDILTTFYATLNAMIAVETVLPQWLVLVKGMSAGETLRSILRQMEGGRVVYRMTGPLKPEICQGDIEINNVTFSYPSAPQYRALNCTTFFFPAGETTFLVGRSGSGKSTVGNLIMKYYDPEAGAVLIDGHPLLTLDVDWLRNNITLIQQKSVIFNETVWKNIAFGDQSHGNVQRESMLSACETAQLDDTLNDLPDGLDTLIGPNIRALSGGQKQRISIARGRLRDAPVLILDEATSELDHISRTQVMEAIRKWRRGKTTIIITHEISQVKDDDYVYVLEQGVVVQEGYKKKLAELENGTFASFLTIEPDSEYESDVELQRHKSGQQSRSPSPLSPESPSYPTLYPETSSPFDLNVTPRSGYVAKFLGMEDIPSNPYEKALVVQKGNRLSLGVGSLYANDLRTDNLWSSPVIAEEDKFSTFRRPSIPFPSYKSSTPKVTAQEDISPKRTSVEIHGLVMPSRQVLRAIDTDNLGTMANIELVRTKTAERSTKGLDEIRDGNASLRVTFRTLWPALAFKDKAMLVLGFLAALIVAGATPAFSYVFAKLLDVFYLTTNQTAEARKWALSLLAVAFVDGLASFATRYSLEHSGQAWVNSLRVEALKRILNQPKSWFDIERNSPDQLSGYLDRNAEEMRNLVGRFAGVAFIVIWMLGVSLVWAFIISWKLTLVALAGAPVFYVVTRGFNMTTAKWEGRCNAAGERTSSIFTETFSNIRVVRALTLESHFQQKYLKAAQETYRVGKSRAIYSGILYGLSDSVSLFIVALIFYYGTVIITNGDITVGVCLQVVNLLLFGIANSGSLLSMIPQISSSRTTAANILYLANLPYKASHEAQGTVRLASPFPITMDSLSFTYPNRPESRTLNKINLTLQSGSCTAIVGSSGSGKSTLASILLGLYPPDQSPGQRHNNSLRLAGTPISDCNIASLRTQIAIVSQTPTIFPATVAQNITYGLAEGSPLASSSNITKAAAQAGIHDYITSLPSGYLTLIGEGGQGLSGGQAQRIAIARALIRRPKLLILDEATSALDVESAEVIRNTIRSLVKVDGMSILIITHNVEMMRIAGHIVVLDHGKVVDQGGFEELKEHGGAFTRLIGKKKRTAKAPAVIKPPVMPFGGRSRGSWIRQESA
ncbi:hypothetical protein BP6252_07231 [Coleophoma cylindrospora]|uniref:Uncharacterized protein n=1 Tax=Coleophoma cylindrospora TaxID=1849047 RepID=A0A3D8RHF3_9HELO|nr:hypothetical protein BP6252_07231 [Coleophoma cylindrospora]